MSENKNAKTPADGPEYERGFVEGMQRQMQLHVNKIIKEEPTGWVKVYETAPPKKAWVGLTDEEHDSIKHNYHNMTWTLEMFARAIEQALKEKNHG